MRSFVVGTALSCLGLGLPLPVHAQATVTAIATVTSPAPNSDMAPLNTENSATLNTSTENSATVTGATPYGSDTYTLTATLVATNANTGYTTGTLPIFSSGPVAIHYDSTGFFTTAPDYGVAVAFTMYYGIIQETTTTVFSCGAGSNTKTSTVDQYEFPASMTGSGGGAPGGGCQVLLRDLPLLGLEM